MAADDSLDRSFVWPHLWWRRSLFAGEGLHKPGWHLNTLIEGHTQPHAHTPLRLPLSHCLGTSLPPLSASSSFLSQPLVTDPGGGWWHWHIVSSPLSRLSFFPLFLTHRSTPTHGVIINTSPISIFHTVCLEKASEPGLGRVEGESEKEREGC